MTVKKWLILDLKGNLKIVSQPCKTNLLKKSFQKSQVGPCTLFVYAPTAEAAAALNYSACLAQLSARHQTIFCTLFFFSCSTVSRTQHESCT